MVAIVAFVVAVAAAVVESDKNADHHKIQNKKASKTREAQPAWLVAAGAGSLADVVEFQGAMAQII